MLTDPDLQWFLCQAARITLHTNIHTHNPLKHHAVNLCKHFHCFRNIGSFPGVCFVTQCKDERAASLQSGVYMRTLNLNDCSLRVHIRVINHAGPAVRLMDQCLQSSLPVQTHPGCLPVSGHGCHSAGGRVRSADVHAAERDGGPLTAGRSAQPGLQKPPGQKPEERDGTRLLFPRRKKHLLTEYGLLYIQFVFISICQFEAVSICVLEPLCFLLISL